jgi:hypothetical protein
LHFRIVLKEARSTFRKTQTISNGAGTSILLKTSKTGDTKGNVWALDEIELITKN